MWSLPLRRSTDYVSAIYVWGYDQRLTTIDQKLADGFNAVLEAMPIWLWSMMKWCKWSVYFF